MDSWHLLPQVPIDVTTGQAASPVDTRLLGPHLNSWVDWDNVTKAQENNSNTKVATPGVEPGTFQLVGQY